jgi:predicted DNA-binding ribbon-helix-helix protein
MPIGIQTFEKMIDGKWAYVDKTAVMHELANDSTVNFLSRPRRFGKSLMLSTLKSYFEGRDDLFKGLAAEKLEPSKENGGWQEHIVFHFDFSSGDYVHDAISVLHEQIVSCLKPIEELCGITVTDDKMPYNARFENAVKAATEKSGRKVIVLIDEYDKPMLQRLERGEKEQEIVRTRLRGFYSALKPLDPYLRFVILTGVTRFSQLSIFSDLNQLRDISFDKKYATICGITQTELEANFVTEIEELAQENSLTYDEALAKLKDTYDGYDFSGRAEKVYNPFSTINVLATGTFKYYWFQTGTPTMLLKQIVADDFDVPDLENEVTASEIDIMNYRPGSDDVVPLLFQTGYLTIKNRDDMFGEYTLGFPNNEVRHGFYNALVRYFTDKDRKIAGINEVTLIKDLRQENLDDFFKRLTAFYAGVTYMLASTNEKHYQTIFYALMSNFAKMEHMTSNGRIDALIELPNQVYIFEFKTTDNGTAESALQRINDKNYAAQYKTPTNTRKIYKIGILFDNATRTIKDYKIEQE